MDFVDILPDDETAVTLTRAKEAASGAEIGVELLNLKTGERKSLVRPATFARYLASGHLLFVRDGVASAAHLDTTTKALVSAPVEVFSGVRQQVFTGVAALSCSQTGTCVYVGGATASARTLSIVDRNGTPRALPLPRKSYKAPRFSPDGTRLVWQVEQLNCDIEVYDLDRGAITRLTTGVDEHNPVWTPDGARVTSLTRKNTGREYRILTRPANGSGTEEQAVTLSDNLGPGSVFSWSRNGTLAFTLRGDIWIQERDREARAFFSSQDLEATPAFSPDGRWLAYVSEEAGQLNVFVRPFPGPGEKYPVSAAGGSEPVWSRDGRELFYRNGDRMMAVEVQSATTFSASRPRVLFTGNFMSDRNTPAYDVNARGEFVMLNSNEDERAATQISVLADWFEVLRRQAP
jgi:serine/threonine-protein kinase